MKPFLFLFGVALLFNGRTNAQVNLALSATASHSGGGRTLPYTAKSYNDDIIPTCTSTCDACSDEPWGWVFGGSTQWIEYTWTTAQTFDKVVFYKANRPMSKTTLQYWNGSAYVDILKYNRTICPADSITFPAVTSTKLRFYGQEGFLNPNYREIQVFLNTPPCKGKPAPGTIAGSVSSGTGLCKDTYVSLSVKGAAYSVLGDILYQWQRRTGAVWTAIAGATDTLYAADSLIGSDYRLAVICTNTKDTSYTAVHSLPILPSPDVHITPSGPIMFCIGDTVSLKAKHYPGAVYTWMKDGKPVPGWMFDDFGAVEPGNYTVKVVSSLPCPGYSTSVELRAQSPDFSVNLAPVADSIICEGAMVTLSGSATKSGVAYQWMHDNRVIPGANAPSYIVGAQGYYKLTASDGGVCPAMSRTIYFVVKPKPEAKISVPDGKLQGCEDPGILLTASPDYGHQWMRNGLTVVGWTDDSLLVTRSGSYTVKVRSAGGCLHVSAPVEIMILPSPVPVLSRSGFVLSTSPDFRYYVWKRNGKEESAASGVGKNTFDLVKKGRYTVEVTDENGCTGVSTPIEANDETLSIGSVPAREDIKIYPNPVNTIVLIQSRAPVNVRVENVTGQLITTQQKVNSIDVSGYADGMYLFTISDQEGNVLTKEKIFKMSK